MLILKKLSLRVRQAFITLIIAVLLFAFAPFLSDIEIQYKGMAIMGILFGLIRHIGKDFDIKEAVSSTTKEENSDKPSQ